MSSLEILISNFSGRNMKEHIEEMRKELSEGTAQIFDVREEDEWGMEHLKEASFVPLSELREGKLTGDYNKSKKTYLHCRSGKRVHMAAPILKELGFDNVIPLNEGFDELASMNFPTE